MATVIIIGGMEARNTARMLAAIAAHTEMITVAPSPTGYVVDEYYEIAVIGFIADMRRLICDAAAKVLIKEFRQLATHERAAHPAPPRHLVTQRPAERRMFRRRI